MKHILIADDNADIRQALSALLRSKGLNPVPAASPKDVMVYLSRQQADLILLDMNYSQDTTSGTEGLELIQQIRAQDENTPIVVMTAYANIPLVVDALKRGANDFVEKPWDNQRLMNIIESQLQLAAGKQREDAWVAENNRQVAETARRYICESPAMAEVIDIIDRIAQTDASVLITGEHGTGKSQLAQLIHAKSNRAENPFISVNIGALSDQLFESELFGHVRGAFTDAKQAREGRFKLAHKGTLFLDEIGNLSADLQAKLLRVLESGEFEPVGSSTTEWSDVRLIAATNADLQAKIAAGQFREDLLFRVNAIELHLPPLRERGEDIVPLADYFLEDYKNKYQRPDLALSKAARIHLQRYPWPGNIRELSHVLQRAVLLSKGPDITPEALNLNAGVSNSENWQELTLEEIEIKRIRHALSQSQGNMKRAAELLGIGRSALYRKMDKHRLND